MFLDIRDFTARAAGAEPKAVIKLLNRFLQKMVAIIENETRRHREQIFG